MSNLKFEVGQFYKHHDSPHLVFKILEVLTVDGSGTSVLGEAWALLPGMCIKVDHCQMLKYIEFKNTHIYKLDYEQLTEGSFWGAQHAH